MDPTVTYSMIQSKCPFRILPLTPKHQWFCLQWCQVRTRTTRNATDWKDVVFRDKHSSFWGQMIIVWECPDEWYDSNQAVVQHTTTAGCNGLGTIAYDILWPHIEPFLHGLSGTIFQQDNAHLHTTRVAWLFTLCSYSSMATLHPGLVSYRACVRPAEMPDAAKYSVHDLEVAVSDLWAHLLQDNKCLFNSQSD